MIKFTIRLGVALYTRLKEYANREEITIMAAIRQILTQFFKDKK
jgi:hypothetical protein